MTAVSTTSQEDVTPAGVRPYRDVAAEHIIAETGCTPEEAQAAIEWLQRLVDAARQNNYATCYPTDAELDTPAYQVVEQIMPHGAKAAAGSAHDAVQTLLLDPKRDERSLTHDEDNNPNSATYCQFHVRVERGVDC